MPAKSKHGRGKHPHRNKVRQQPQMAATGQPVPAAQPLQAGQTAPAKPAAAPIARAGGSPARKAAANVSAIATMDRSLIVGELKFIGILTGIVVIVMIILAVIFR
ncbi:MAG: hypothetical protein ABR886_04645 [Dehalococcoidales bacterium]|jgi:hypothetical protein